MQTCFFMSWHLLKLPSLKTKTQSRTTGFACSVLMCFSSEYSRPALVQVMYCTVTLVPLKAHVKVAVSPALTGGRGSTWTLCNHCPPHRPAKHVFRFCGSLSTNAMHWPSTKIYGNFVLTNSCNNHERNFSKHFADPLVILRIGSNKHSFLRVRLLCFFVCDLVTFWTKSKITKPEQNPFCTAKSNKLQCRWVCILGRGK